MTISFQKVLNINSKEIVNKFFYYVCLYHYDKLVEFLLKEKCVEERIKQINYIKIFSFTK